MKLRVSPDGHFLQRDDGHAFFYLADTARELFHRLTTDEAREYLETRAAQGFTVIQAVMLAEFDGLRTPNALGHLPFRDLDPLWPDEAADGYWSHVDEVIVPDPNPALVPGAGDRRLAATCDAEGRFVETSLPESGHTKGETALGGTPTLRRRRGSRRRPAR